jgi:hypothetical protein
MRKPTLTPHILLKRKTALRLLTGIAKLVIAFTEKT